MHGSFGNSLIVMCGDVTITKMNAYPNNYIIVNKTMPDIARIAFVAGLIYDA